MGSSSKHNLNEAQTHTTQLVCETMARTIREKVCGQGGGFRRFGPSLSRQDLQSQPLNGGRLRDNTDSSSNDSTKPPDVILEIEFPNSMVENRCNDTMVSYF